MNQNTYDPLRWIHFTPFKIIGVLNIVGLFTIKNTLIVLALIDNTRRDLDIGFKVL